MSQQGVAGGVRFVSLLLVIGGIVGIFITLWLYVPLLGQSGWRMPLTAAILGLFLVVFGWSVWTGIDLWRGKTQAYKWAKILFAAQIPILRVAGFLYEFHTGLTVRLIAGSVFSFNFHLGSSMSLYFSSVGQDSYVGVNLFAIFVLLYLVRVSSPSYDKPKDNFGLIAP